MRVDIEKGHIGSYERIAKEANRAIKRDLKLKKNGYKKLLLQKDISVENKKKRLVENLHELIISTFSVNIKQVNNKTLGKVKTNIELIR